MTSDICKESHCSVLPPYILTNITNHPNAPESAKACARNALRFTSTCHQRRNDFINRRLNATQGHPSGFVSGIILNNITSSAGTQSKSAGPKRLNRVVYTANNTEILDYTLLRSEGGAATNDAAADECYDGFGSTFNFYSDVFDRNSINDAGMTLIGTVHYEQASNDAKWDGAQMIFGDGDGVYFNRFTSSLDVIGHELTHGVTQYTANLVYQGQSGALNESMSDVFGIMVKQYKQNQSSAQSDWLIGAGLFTWQVKGVALRSMKNPGTAYDDPVIGRDLQVSTYAEVLSTSYPDTFDNGGVHIYSGVPNRAFYLVATNLGGNAWDRAGRIWWSVLSGGNLKPTANFHDFAKLTCAQAESLYGQFVKAVVVQAWKDVGIETEPKPQPPPPPPRLEASGRWAGSKSRSHLQCTFTVSGDKLTGSGSMTHEGKVSPFTVVDGYHGNHGHVRFELKFQDPHTSNEKYKGKISSSGRTISGTWENVNRGAFLKAGWPDNWILSGSFELRK